MQWQETKHTYEELTFHSPITYYLPLTRRYGCYNAHQLIIPTIKFKGPSFPLDKTVEIILENMIQKATKIDKILLKNDTVLDFCICNRFRVGWPKNFEFHFYIL